MTPEEPLVYPHVQPLSMPKYLPDHQIDEDHCCRALCAFLSVVFEVAVSRSNISRVGAKISFPFADNDKRWYVTLHNLIHPQQ